MSVFELKGTQRPRVLADEINYQIQVNEILLASTRRTRTVTMSKAEFVEMDEAYFLGVSAQGFAERLQQRDLRALPQTVERTGETYPMVFAKPLSREDALMLDFLIERYVANDSTPLLKFEDEKTVTLRVPEVIRRVQREVACPNA